MNRREMLKAAGFAASSVALESATGISAAASQPGRKYKIIITGGHPGDPEYDCGGSVARLRRRVPVRVRSAGGRSCSAWIV